MQISHESANSFVAELLIFFFRIIIKTEATEERVPFPWLGLKLRYTYYSVALAVLPFR